MIESLLTISILGFLVGFLMSIPIAGPISIFILSNALKGEKSFCFRASIGSAIADFIYVFIASFGITTLFTFISSYISYILLVGSFFLIFVGIKIIRTQLNIEEIRPEKVISESIQKRMKGGLRSGFLINFLNPTLFFGWLTSSFIAISLAASLGFNTGGMNEMIDFSVQKIQQGADVINAPIDLTTNNGEFAHEAKIEKMYFRNFPLILSFLYAFFLSAGSMIWFFLMTILVIRYKALLNKGVLLATIRILGVILCLFALWLFYLSFKNLFWG